mmetsp:Transcript_134816/g.430846  ORF Transcript_134816/g.430846 Transcript_134816/m.430846 type:complete len:85 (+) Transcript_134816:40-294(+)
MSPKYHCHWQAFECIIRGYLPIRFGMRVLACTRVCVGRETIYTDETCCSDRRICWSAIKTNLFSTRRFTTGVRFEEREATSSEI